MVLHHSPEKDQHLFQRKFFCLTLNICWSPSKRFGFDLTSDFREQTV